MRPIEEILNDAIIELRKGAPKQEILSKYPETMMELEPLLELAEVFWHMPKNQPPKPAMQRKYALATVAVKFAWFAWLKTSKLAAVTMSLVLLLTTGVGAALAAHEALPGSPFFSLKKVEERIRLALATSATTQAKLQVQFANNRLSEAQVIFNNPKSGPEAQQAALSALVNETQNTVNAVSAASKDSKFDQNGHPIVNSLEPFAKKQTALLNQIKAESKDTSDAAKSAILATKESTAKITEIKNFIIAASNEQTLANLELGPNAVTISGFISKLAKDNVTVEKTSFIISDQTSIKNADNNISDVNSLRVNGKIKLVGHKTDNKLFADQIFIIKADVQNTEKENSDPVIIDPVKEDKNPNITSTPKSILNLPAAPVKTEPPVNPNTATGGLIIEDPSPQMPAK